MRVGSVYASFLSRVVLAMQVSFATGFPRNAGQSLARMS
jgi:hypothetical protein